MTSYLDWEKRMVTDVSYGDVGADYTLTVPYYMSDNDYRNVPVGLIKQRIIKALVPLGFDVIAVDVELGVQNGKAKIMARKL